MVLYLYLNKTEDFHWMKQIWLNLSSRLIPKTNNLEYYFIIGLNFFT